MRCKVENPDALPLDAASSNRPAVNPELELAFDLIRYTDKCLFLTGKAGSGKATFLHQIRAESPKRMAVVAPTGVAAINAGGMTIHSLFQIPLGLHLPGVSRMDPAQQRRFSKTKVRLLQSLDLLVIDEISMVRADLLDAVDEVLRRFRHAEKPFGGVQLLMIGDLHQLPPVLKPDEWEILSRSYESPYFFSSHALHETDYQCLELKHIYRQSDPDFIELLNRVRNNCLDQASLRKLNTRYVSGFQPPSDEAYITLTTTNAVARQINAANLRHLPGKPLVYSARVQGDFPPSSYPTEVDLRFKPGAQVMLIRNEPGKAPRYYNGKIGQIARMDANAIYVVCPGQTEEISVEPAEWQNVKFTLNEETRQIEERILGTFTQMPLKLAWAITIHKSQGLTFERAIIDAQAAFASGQVYVALSCCKSFEGIVLRSPLSQSSIKTDRVVQTFSEQADQNAPDRNFLLQARRAFECQLLRELFSFEQIRMQFDQLLHLYRQHSHSLAPETVGQFQEVINQVTRDMINVTEKLSGNTVISTIWRDMVLQKQARKKKHGVTQPANTDSSLTRASATKQLSYEMKGKPCPY